MLQCVRSGAAGRLASRRRWRLLHFRCRSNCGNFERGVSIKLAGSVASFGSVFLRKTLRSVKPLQGFRWRITEISLNFWGTLLHLDRPTTIAQSGYISTLDGWRAIAVMLVIGSHSITMLDNNGTRPALILRSFFEHTGYGVDIFFALSGFLISNILLREKKNTSSVDLTRFYIRRAFRVPSPYRLLPNGVFYPTSSRYLSRGPKSRYYWIVVIC